MSDFKEFLDKILKKESPSVDSKKQEKIESTEMPLNSFGFKQVSEIALDYLEHLKTQLNSKKHENLRECNRLAIDFYGIEDITAQKGYEFASGFKFSRGAPGKVIDEKAINLFNKEDQKKIWECLNKNQENILVAFDGILSVLPAKYIYRKKAKK